MLGVASRFEISLTITTSSHASSFHAQVDNGPRNSTWSPTLFEWSHRPTSPLGYFLIQKSIRPCSSMPWSGVYGRSTCISSSLMNTDHIGARGVCFCAGGRWTVRARSLVSGPLGSLEVRVARVKWEGDSEALSKVGAERDLSGRKR